MNIQNGNLTAQERAALKPGTEVVVASGEHRTVKGYNAGQNTVVFEEGGFRYGHESLRLASFTPAPAGECASPDGHRTHICGDPNDPCDCDCVPNQEPPNLGKGACPVCHSNDLSAQYYPSPERKWYSCRSCGAKWDETRREQAPAGECASCKQLRAEVDQLNDVCSWRGDRLTALQCAQADMRDPERTMVCDILANGTLLEPPGDRYAVKEAPAGECAECAEKDRNLTTARAVIKTLRDETDELRQRCVNQAGRANLLEEVAANKEKDLALAEKDNQALSQQVEVLSAESRLLKTQLECAEAAADAAREDADVETLRGEMRDLEEAYHSTRRERDILQKLVDERQMAAVRGKTPADLAIAALKEIAQGGAR